MDEIYMFFLAIADCSVKMEQNNGTKWSTEKGWESLKL